MSVKICFITPLYSPANLSGSSLFVKNLAEALAEKGWDVSVITSNALTSRYWYDPFFGKANRKNFEIINNVKVYRLSCNQLFSTSSFIISRKLSFLLPDKFKNKLKILSLGPWLKGLERILAKENFQVIHSSPFPLNLNFQVAKAIEKLSKKPKIIFSPLFHTEIPEFKNPQLKPLLKIADKIHCLTKTEAKFVKKTFEIEESKIQVIPLFLFQKKPFSKAKVERTAKRIKKKYNLENKKIVLFVGNKGYYKGVLTLIKAAREIYKWEKNFKLITVGNSMPEWRREKKKEDKEFLLDFGYLPELEKQALFSLCDVYVMPSLSESFGLAYLEAWREKKPVIAADIPAMREIIAKNQAGLLVKFDDTKELIKTIKKLINNKSLALYYGKNGNRVLKQKYTLSKVLPLYKRLFCEN